MAKKVNPAQFQEQVELEMSYEPYSSLTSCLEPHLTEDGDLRDCRRLKNHTDLCASGFGSGFVTWKKAEPELYNQSFESYN